MKLSKDMMFPLPPFKEKMREKYPELKEIDDFTPISEAELRFILTWYDQSNFREFQAKGWETARRMVADMDDVGLYGKKIPEMGGKGSEKFSAAIVTFLIMQSSMDWAELCALQNQFYTIIEDCAGKIDIAETEKAEKAHEIRSKNLMSLEDYSKRIRDLKKILLPDAEKEKVVEAHMNSMRKLSPERRASGTPEEDDQ